MERYERAFYDGKDIHLLLPMLFGAYIYLSKMVKHYSCVIVMVCWFILRSSMLSYYKFLFVFGLSS